MSGIYRRTNRKYGTRKIFNEQEQGHDERHYAYGDGRPGFAGGNRHGGGRFQAYVMLHAGKDEVRRLISGAAYQFKSGVQSESQNIATKRFADVHGTIAERFYNILCLAYGADEELFKDIVANGYLPKGRAEGCSDEYANVAYAFKTLIGPYIDRKLAAKMHKNWLPPVNTRPPLRPTGLAVKSPE